MIDKGQYSLANVPNLSRAACALSLQTKPALSRRALRYAWVAKNILPGTKQMFSFKA